MEIKEALKSYGKDRDFTVKIKGRLNGKDVTLIKHLKWERLIHKIKYAFSSKYRESFKSALNAYNTTITPPPPSSKKEKEIAITIFPSVVQEDQTGKKIKKFEEEILSLEQKVAEFETRKQQFEERIEQVNSRLKQLTEASEQAKLEVDRQEQELKLFEDEDIKPLIRKTHEETIKAVEDKINEKYFLVARQGGQEAIDARRRKLRDLKAMLEITSLDQRKQSLESAKSSHRSAIDTLNAYKEGNPLEGTENELSQVQEGIAFVEKEIKEKKAQIAELKGEEASAEEPSLSEEIKVAEVEETPSVTTNPLNEHSIKFLAKIEDRLGKESKELWEILLTRFAREYNEDRMVSFEEKNDVVKLKFSSPLMLWLLSTDENGNEDPVGGIITMLGCNRFAGREADHEVEIKFEENKMVFNKGYESLSPFPKNFAGLASKLGKTTTDATIHHFKVENKGDAQIFKIEGQKKILGLTKKAEKVKSFDELKNSWSAGGEVLSPDIDITEYLKKRIEERKEANKQSK